MKFWTFFDPQPDAPPSDARVRDIVVVKEGVAWIALLVPLFWLAWHKLWWELLAIFALFVAMGLSLSFMPITSFALGAINLLMHVTVALVGNDLRCRKLERKGYQSVAVLSAPNQLAAEALFFDVWMRADARQVMVSQDNVAPAGAVAVETV